MRTIEIRTTQNVIIQYELAALRERFLALFIDILIVSGIYSTIMIFLWSIFQSEMLESGAFAGFFSIGLFIFYQLFSEILADGQSWGKKAMGIKVVRLDGKQPNLSDYLLRAVFYIIDFIASAGILGALLISSSTKSQRLGDMTANTTVIHVKFDLRFRLEDILKINTLEDYEPSYPEVRRLSEKDMLLIKTIISRYRKHRNKAHIEVINELISILMKKLDITERPKDKINFLKTLIRDYIVLTR